MDTQSIINFLETVINSLYLVGGTLRDEIMGKYTSDIDLATPLLPDDVQQKLKKAGIKTYTVGKKFGTIACKIDDHDIQITTFRGEIYTNGSRRPRVNYVNDIMQDLSRRDFTMNALAKKDNKILDPFEGESDIKNKIIRAVGIADERFAEDPLRMLRAFRFVSELGFTIDSKTNEAINNQAPSILIISKERLSSELNKIMLGDNYLIALQSLIKNKLFKYLLPDLYLVNLLRKDEIILNDSNDSMNIENKMLLRWLTFIESLIKEAELEDDKLFIGELLNRIAIYYRWPKRNVLEARELLE